MVFANRSGHDEFGQDILGFIGHTILDEQIGTVYEGPVVLNFVGAGERLLFPCGSFPKSPAEPQVGERVS